MPDRAGLVLASGLVVARAQPGQARQKDGGVVNIWAVLICLLVTFILSRGTKALAATLVLTGTQHYTEIDPTAASPRRSPAWACP